MTNLYKRWDTPSFFGALIVAVFLLVQCLDGVLTYLGISIWGLGVEANPLASSAVSPAGLGVGLAAAKLVAASRASCFTSGVCTIWSRS